VSSEEVFCGEPEGYGERILSWSSWFEVCLDFERGRKSKTPIKPSKDSLQNDLLKMDGIGQ
jgi:hypothetical protein